MNDECVGSIEPRPESLDGQDDNCNGHVDEPWRPMVRCRHPRAGGFRFRDALDRSCFDGFDGPHNQGRPYFHLAKGDDRGVELADVEDRRVVLLHNLWHGCRGQLLTASEEERDIVMGQPGWSEVEPRWYALATQARAPWCPGGAVPVYRYADASADCDDDGPHDNRYLFLPPGPERDGLNAPWRPENNGRPVFCAWPNP